MMLLLPFMDDATNTLGVQEFVSDRPPECLANGPFFEGSPRRSSRTPLDGANPTSVGVRSENLQESDGFGSRGRQTVSPGIVRLDETSGALVPDHGHVVVNLGVGEVRERGSEVRRHFCWWVPWESNPQPSG
jgi:hypothetical protein